jgi:hypothetical protein
MESGLEESMLKRIVSFQFVMWIGILVIIGCAGTPPTAPIQPTQPSAAAPLDACAIFTQADADALLAKSVQKKPSPVTAKFASVVSTCFYQAADSLFDSAELIVRDLETSADAQKAYALTMNDLSSAGLAATAVSGLGEQAHWFGAAPSKQLHVLNGKWVLIFTVVGQNNDDAKWQSAVRQMLSRLP